MREKILKILFNINPEIEKCENSNIIEQGIIDSFDIMNMVSELEAAFEFEFDADDIIAENFNTVDSIVKLVEKRTSNI